jgi:hypothetical protein
MSQARLRARCHRARPVGSVHRPASSYERHPAGALRARRRGRSSCAARACLRFAMAARVSPWRAPSGLPGGIRPHAKTLPSMRHARAILVRDAAPASIGHQCPNRRRSPANSGNQRSSSQTDGRWTIPLGNAENCRFGRFPSSCLSRRRPRGSSPVAPVLNLAC